MWGNYGFAVLSSFWLWLNLAGIETFLGLCKSLKRKCILTVLKCSVWAICKESKQLLTEIYFYSKGKAGQCPPLLKSFSLRATTKQNLSKCAFIAMQNSVPVPQLLFKRPTFNYNVMNTWSWQAFTGKEAGACGEVLDWLKGSFRSLNITYSTTPIACMHEHTARKGGEGETEKEKGRKISFQFPQPNKTTSSSINSIWIMSISDARGLPELGSEDEFEKKGWSMW